LGKKKQTWKEIFKRARKKLNNNLRLSIDEYNAIKKYYRVPDALKPVDLDGVAM